MTGDALITLQDVAVRYGRREALHDISGAFHRGSLTAIAGPNGAGKSTLLKTIAGIVRPARGTVMLAPELNGHIAYLPQATHMQRDFPITVLQAVCTGFWNDIGDIGRIDHARQSQAMAALAAVGVESLARRTVAELSGGQFQRLLFARVALQDAPLILLDEPFTAVDAETTLRLMRLVLDWNREGRTIICVLHDLLLIRKYFPESFVLAGHCLGRGHTHAMFEQKLLSFDLDMAELLPPDHAREAHDHHGHEHARTHDHNHDHDHHHDPL